MSQKRIKRPFSPIELPQEFFDDGNRAVLDNARTRTLPIRVAVLFLIRDGKPPSPITWEPDFGDDAGLKKVIDDLHEMNPFLLPGERLEARIVEVEP